MNDKEFKAKKKQVIKILDEWIDRLGLRWYSFQYVWKMGDPPERGEGYSIAAYIECQWMYRSATITLYVEMMPEENKEIEKIIVHELCHIFVNPLRSQYSIKEYDYDLEEYVTENLAQAFIWTYQDRNKE